MQHCTQWVPGTVHTTVDSCANAALYTVGTGDSSHYGRYLEGKGYGLI
jgi:hypothetical protein